jgi:hypothetical protein
MCRSVEARAADMQMFAANLLRTIYERLKDLVRSSVYLHMDEAFTKLFDTTRPGKARDAYASGFLAPHEQAMVMAATRVAKGGAPSLVA